MPLLGSEEYRAKPAANATPITGSFLADWPTVDVRTPLRRPAMKQIPAPLLTLVAGVAVTFISLWVGQNNNWLPVQASEQAVLVDNFFNVMVVIATALFIVVEGAIVYSLIAFRRRPGDDTDGLPIEGNLPLEAFWTAIPAVIVIGLGIYSVYVFQEMGGFSPGEQKQGGTLVAQAPKSIASDVRLPLLEGGELVAAETKIPVYGFGASPDGQGQTADVEVKVTGLQYAWIFNYPATGITDGELHIPVGKDIQLNITAQDVIHSFWVPPFRLKQDAIPGETTELRFVATKPGTYPVVCTELCGAYHGAMRTQVVVHTPEDYDEWVKSRIASASTSEESVALQPAKTDQDYLQRYGQGLEVDPSLVAHNSSMH